MIEYGLPVLFALFLWWFSTGLVLFLDGLPRNTFRWTMLGVSALAATSLWGISATSADTSVAGAYLAFTCGLVAWGWQEMSHYLGYVTGPRRAPCPPGCSHWQRFCYATAAIAWHELAIAAGAVMIVALTWNEPNQVGTWTYLVLWWMRLSAKLNVFLGVPNLNEDWLPAHLHYLCSYFGRKPMNTLFPLSVTAATVVLVMLVQALLAAPTGTHEATGLLLTASLLGLAILEHWFLVLPVPDEMLWRWGMKSRHGPGSPERAAASSDGPVTIAVEATLTAPARRSSLTGRLQPRAR